MLWIGGKVSAMKLIEHLLIPALLTIVIPLLIAKRIPIFKGRFEVTEVQKTQKNAGFVLVTGLFLIILVPVFKTVTHLPPYMGMLFSLAIFALIGEVLSKRQLNLSSIDEKNKADHVGPTLKSLSKIEMPSILFFLGILMTVAGLETMGLIEQFGEYILSTGISKELYISLLGIGSAIVDNVPLVAASMGMFKDAMDADSWHMIAFAAGTGGSILIIGSAAGVVAMGMEQIAFGWYLKRIAPLALIGYLSGLTAFLFL
jgi:Na+/H+ antiporter NhaD/arsenite permease-like protein